MIKLAEMISYMGGKSRISGWIKEFIPEDIETYVEPFGGMFWVFFKLDLDIYKNLKTIVYNDVNPLNTNLFNCVKHHKEFYEHIKTYKSQKKKLFYQYQKELFDNPKFKLNLSKPNYEVGAKYAYLLTQVWSGSNPATSSYIDLKGKYKSKFDSFVDKLSKEKWQQLFDKITVTENLNYIDVIDKYDGDHTFFYVDPPYYETEDYYANHKFDKNSHKELAKTLRNIKGEFACSYYTFDDLKLWYPKDRYTWKSKNFKKQSGASKGKEQSKSREVLIMNY